MKCPECGAALTEKSVRCTRCGVEIASPSRPPVARGMRAASAIMWTFFALISLIFLALASYRIYFWISAWHTDEIYDSMGVLAPEVDVLELDDGRVAHAITFYGEDGDSVFIKELRRSYMISGGLARIEIADSSWFDLNPDDVEAAIITLTPILETEGGDRIPLPVMELTIEPPASPLRLISPASDFETVNTSMYQLSVAVVPGSTVLLNGLDVTDMVDYAGVLSANINVYAKGENVISLLVNTANHRQTRQEIVLYRAPQEINLEPSLNLNKSSSRETMTISGSVDPQATLSVDTPYEEGSIKVDAEGNFSFTAKFSAIGDNVVTVRASMEGKVDSVITLTINYVPNLNTYSRKAWKMDYEGLKLMYEEWAGYRIFLCQGEIVDVIAGDPQILVMDVGTEGTQQLVLLENHTENSYEAGGTYRAYADVLGREYYETDYCPKLAARYILTD